MFIDTLKLTLSGGKGGDGVIAWRREKFIPKGGPAGGNGGAGGRVFLESDTDLISLEHLTRKTVLSAANGSGGGGACKQGKAGADLIIKVPLGTLIHDKTTGELLYDFTQKGQTFCVCLGGKGGRGNATFRSATTRAPYICTPGTPGETKEITLDLKLIADVGFIGMPNAGKSTLLAHISGAPVKIGAYPFTTLHPNLGYITRPNTSRVLIADIPGIIEKAHTDKGLGLRFLKHIERSSALVYVLDGSGFEDRSPLNDFYTLKQELAAYNPEILKKPFLVVLNKNDIEGSDEHLNHFIENSPCPKENIFSISAHEKIGLEALVKKIHTFGST